MWLFGLRGSFAAPGREKPSSGIFPELNFGYGLLWSGRACWTRASFAAAGREKLSSGIFPELNFGYGLV